MQCTNDGLTLWYDTTDAPVNNGAITIGVRPAHWSNSVTVRYRVDGGVTRFTSARVVSAGFPADRQYFQAAIPGTPPGAVVEFLPVLSCSGRQAPAADEISSGRFAWCSYRTPVESPTVAAAAASTRPAASSHGPQFTSELEYLGTVRVTLSPPETIGKTPQGLRKNFYIQSGSCIGPKLNATVRSVGADWLLIQRDGVGLPNVRTTWETSDGAVLYGDYCGTFDLGPDGYENALHDRFPDSPPVVLAPRLVTSHPRYLWLNRLQCVGIGRVEMAKLLVQYDLHAIKAAEPRVR